MDTDFEVPLGTIDNSPRLQPQENVPQNIFLLPSDGRTTSFVCKTFSGFAVQRPKNCDAEEKAGLAEQASQPAPMKYE